MKKRILSAISIVLMGTLMVFVSCKEEQKKPTTYQRCGSYR